MSVAAHHNDWLNLVEVSGPFLALPVIMDALPAGLDKPERELTADLWRAFTEWSDEDHGGATDPAVHEAWVRYVFEHVLGYDPEVLVRHDDALETWTVEVPEHDASLTPDLVVRDPEDDEGDARLLITIVAPDVSVTDPSETRWTASPAERMELLLKDAQARLGVLTNGDQWTLVHVAEGENTGFATWYASLWREEPLTLRAFTTLLGMRRFFAAAENETLEALLDRSREDQQGVTTQLGKQVRRAIEILIQQVDRVDHDRDGRLLEGMTEERLYESAVTVMMRLIFLFYAEENDLLLLGDDFYDQGYAASTLREQLQATADESGEEILERFHDAWPRLLSTFRAVHTGVEHEQMRLPAYGGALFDPDRYPFLEGREAGTTWLDVSADPLPIDNRTVLHLLNAIQTLEVKVAGGGRENRPLSFRALDVEQIGHVYETLLDHTAVRADDWIFGLEGTKDKEPEVPLGKLEARADDPKELVEYLKDETGRSAGALKKRVAAEEKAVYDRWGQRWTPAFQGDEGTARRATPWGLLVREDSAEHPVVVPPGRVYVTESERRRSSGTHYTPRSLTEEIVTHALEPLVYDGPADGKDRTDWELRSPDEILDLKVCDPACGSGAFLVQACRYLAERLVEAWNEHSASDGPDGHALPADPEERLIVARRYVADRCLYGVDINPLATEMAKLSLWLVTLQKNRPFTFLDHAVLTGDSLLGVMDFETLETFGVWKGQTQLWAQSWAPHLKAARETREELRSFSVIDPKDADRKRSLLERASGELSNLRMVADAIAGVQLGASLRKQTDVEGLRRDVGSLIEQAFSSESDSARGVVRQRARELLDEDLPSGDDPRSPFHWVLEFPEVMGQGGGFDAFVGNPPFVGGRKISGAMGPAYRSYLVGHVAEGTPGSADYVAYFFLRVSSLIRGDGFLGFVATNSVAQGDTREVGLDRLTASGWTIFRGVRSEPWPSGGASLEIAHVWATRRPWEGRKILEGREVESIGPDLRVGRRVSGTPQPVNCQPCEAFQGSNLNGIGFALDPDLAETLLLEEPASDDVLKQFMNGRDLNSRPTVDGGRWVIFFRDWPWERAQKYPAALKLVRERVKLQRDKLPDYKKRVRDHWWQFEHVAMELYDAIADFDEIFTIALTSSLIMPARVSSDHVFQHSIGVFATDDVGVLGVLSSGVHVAWVMDRASTMKADTRYTLEDCFRTYVFPALTTDIGEAAQSLERERTEVMADQELGLTKVYNRVHNVEDETSEIRSLRQLHVLLDEAVIGAYGWQDVKPNYGFHDTQLGTRFGLDPLSAAEVVDRLLELNLAASKELRSVRVR